MPPPSTDTPEDPLPPEVELQCILTMMQHLAAMEQEHGVNEAETTRRRAAKKRAKHTRRRNRK